MLGLAPRRSHRARSQQRKVSKLGIDVVMLPLLLLLLLSAAGLSGCSHPCCPGRCRAIDACWAILAMALGARQRARVATDSAGGGRRL